MPHVINKLNLELEIERTVYSCKCFMKINSDASFQVLEICQQDILY